MVIYFLTKEPDACQLIADKFSNEKSIVKIFPTVTNLFRDIFDLNILPTVLFLDYLYFEPDLFNPYDLFKSHNKIFPIVFYNHPFPLPNRRKLFWLHQLKKSGHSFNIEELALPLEMLESILLDKTISQFISGIQAPIPFHSSNLRYIEPLNDNEKNYYIKNYNNVITDFLSNSNKKEKPTQKIDSIINPKVDTKFLDAFRIENKLSHNLYKIFEYLYIYKNIHVSSQDLRNLIARKEKLSENGLRILIYRLRKILINNKKYKYTIITFDYGYMLKDIDTD